MPLWKTERHSRASLLACFLGLLLPGLLTCFLAYICFYAALLPRFQVCDCVGLKECAGPACVVAGAWRKWWRERSTRP